MIMSKQPKPGPFLTTEAGRARCAYRGNAVGPPPDEEIILRHLPLAKTLVERMKVRLPAHVDFDDLYSAAVKGLILAARNFDSAQCDVFEAYARRRINGAILDELRKMDPLPRSVRRKSREVEAVTAELEQRLGHVPEPGEVARELGVSLAEYDKLLERIRPVSFLPIDSCPSEAEGEGMSLHELIPDESQPHCAETLEHRESIQALADRIDELPERQKQVLIMYYYEEMRLAEIAEVFQVTEARICQIHGQAVACLRRSLKVAVEGGRGGSGNPGRSVIVI